MLSARHDGHYCSARFHSRLCALRSFCLRRELLARLYATLCAQGDLPFFCLFLVG